MKCVDLKIILMTIPALIGQMLEPRRAGKALADPVRRETGYSNFSTPQRPIPTAILASMVQARDGGNAWMEKESKLNL